MTERALLPVRRPFRAMVEAFVPEAVELTDEQWGRAEETVEKALAARPEAMRRQLRLFIRAVDTLARIRFLRPLGALRVDRRTRFLRNLQRAPLLVVRRGVWGVRTLAFMAYYGLPEVRDAIGYRVRPGGWSEREVG